MDELTANTPIPLGLGTLDRLPKSVRRPDYDRADLRPGIIHIGVGNFHRAHQAWYLHRLMQLGRAQDWAIIGAGVRASDADMRAKLAGQDYLTTLVELAPSHRSGEVTGAMIDYLPVEPDNQALIARMAQPDIRIVSLTVTEGGYFIDPATGTFDPNHDDIQHDAARPDAPRTAFGAIVAALAARRALGADPVTVQSCDNLRGNGAITRAAVVGLAGLTDPDLAGWIDAHCSFPDSMVDCIVPATGPAEIAIAADLGINDAAPVTHENFRQWVIEDNFCAGRPDWDLVGAIFTDQVHVFEAMKIRILNAGHQVLANAGELLSVPTIADCMSHPLIGPFFRKVAAQEIVPHVAPVPGLTADAYLDLIVGRFANPAIRDTTRRVAFDGSARHAGFVLPVLRDALAAGSPVQGLALVEALWARMCAGQREDGTKIAANDPFWTQLQSSAVSARETPQAWLAQGQTYGALAQETRFASAFSQWLTMIWADGTEAALQRYLAE